MSRRRKRAVRRGRSWIRPRLVAGAAVLLVAWAPGPAALAERAGQVASTGVEAWYNVAPLSPGGLPPVNPYPPDTLHVGVTGGTEDSRTYLTLDLSALPPGATVVGGVLTLPVDLDGGTRDVEAAAMEACFVAEPGREVSGSLDPPPKVDCARRSPAVYRDGDRAAFTVDLAPFDDLGDGGLALLANQSTRAEGASWHVALYGRDNESPDAVPISAVLEIALPAGGQGVAGTGPSGGSSALAGGTARLDGAGTPSIALPDFGLPGALAAPSATEIPGAAQGPQSSGTAALSSGSAPARADVIASSERRPYALSLAFTLPLLLLVIAGYFASVLNRPVVLATAPAPARSATPRPPASPSPR
jgi:hypothetical protein